MNMDDGSGITSTSSGGGGGGGGGAVWLSSSSGAVGGALTTATLQTVSSANTAPAANTNGSTPATPTQQRFLQQVVVNTLQFRQAPLGRYYRNLIFQ